MRRTLRALAAGEVLHEVGIVGAGPAGLTLSRLLSHYGVKHFLLDRKMEPVIHPQAHFINARSMEVFQSFFPLAHRRILERMSPSSEWRDFVYCHSVLGSPLQRVDHFAATPASFWSSSPSNVAHLAQNRVEAALREELTDLCDFHRGFKATRYTIGDQCSVEATGSCPETSAQRRQLQCRYLVAADGANSKLREHLGIPMEGLQSMQSLINVHFHCKGLRQLLQPRPAMLYFVFNE
ncbi:FAD-binding monooxygenase [Ochromonadaceae sp. CCMP2298]|nr:FAD-binding monooxygenase [Ochromonadaceae sp. CCMP2298]